MPDYPNPPQRQSDDQVPESFAGLSRYERHSEIRQISYYLSGSVTVQPL